MAGSDDRDGLMGLLGLEKFLIVSSTSKSQWGIQFHPVAAVHLFPLENISQSRRIKMAADGDEKKRAGQTNTPPNNRKPDLWRFPFSSAIETERKRAEKLDNNTKGK